MATRKIRLSMSGTQVDDQGPIVDIDFNGVNLDTDVDVTAVHGQSTIVKEYTVDVDTGTFNLNIEYKNDVGDNGDRNFFIDTFEVAHDGTNYKPWFVNEGNSNLENVTNFFQNAYNSPRDADGNALPNPDYDSSLPNTDNDAWHEAFRQTHPGNNPRLMYDAKTGPIGIYTNQVATFSITFS